MLCLFQPLPAVLAKQLSPIAYSVLIVPIACYAQLVMQEFFVMFVILAILEQAVNSASMDTIFNQLYV